VVDLARVTIDVACFNICTHDLIATGTMPNQPVIGTIALENRSHTFW